VGGGVLPLVLSFKDVARQPFGGGKRAELRLHLSQELHRLLQWPCQLLPELHQHLVVRLHELVHLRLCFSGQATGRRVLPRHHLFGFNGLDAASNVEGPHASRRPSPLASYGTGWPTLKTPPGRPRKMLWRRWSRAFSATLLMPSSSYL
jgi:hypothetical protein